MIEIRLLEQLAAFADCGTLSAAAEKLHTSQPSLTRSMRKLEEELGVELFVRQKNHLSFTETGLRAAEYARRALASCEEFVTLTRTFDRSLHTIRIGFCAPVPQSVITPILNSVFEGMTVSADMSDDREFLSHLKDRTYQLAVTHFIPKDPDFYWKACGHEELFITVPAGHPLAFSPEIRLEDLDGLPILLQTRIGFWSQVHRSKTPHTRYLLQFDTDTYHELMLNSDYPSFSSSYFLKREGTAPGRISIPISDGACHASFYLVCLDSEKKRFRPLFDRISEKTID